MEEVHKFNSFAFAQRPIINSSGLVIELDVYRKYLCFFCNGKLQCFEVYKILDDAHGNISLHPWALREQVRSLGL